MDMTQRLRDLAWEEYRYSQEKVERLEHIRHKLMVRLDEQIEEAKQTRDTAYESALSLRNTVVERSN